MADATYRFKFKWVNADGDPIEMKFEATTDAARERWEEQLAISETTGSTGHRAFFRGPRTQRWLPWR